MARQRIKLEGARELGEALNRIGNVAATRRIVRHAMRKAVEPILADARERVPSEHGDLRESLTFSTKLSKRQLRYRPRDADVVFFAGAQPLPYAHLVEFGTGGHTIKVRGKGKRMLADVETGLFFGSKVEHPGTAPHPFLRPAWDAGKDRALKTIQSEAWKSLERRAKREARKALKAAGK